MNCLNSVPYAAGKDYSFMASFFNTEKSAVLGHGVLYSREIVITAAHWIPDNNDSHPVYFGINPKNDMQNNNQDYFTKKIVKYRGFDVVPGVDGYVGNFAFVVLNKKVSKDFQILELYDGDLETDEYSSYVVGWLGHKKYNLTYNIPFNMQKVLVESQSKCSDYLVAKFKFKNKTFGKNKQDDVKVNPYSYNHYGSCVKETKEEDFDRIIIEFGGPLVIKINRIYKLVGLGSFHIHLKGKRDRLFFNQVYYLEDHMNRAVKSI